MPKENINGDIVNIDRILTAEEQELGFVNLLGRYMRRSSIGRLLLGRSSQVDQAMELSGAADGQTAEVVIYIEQSDF